MKYKNKATDKLTFYAQQLPTNTMREETTQLSRTRTQTSWPSLSQAEPT